MSYERGLGRGALMRELLQSQSSQSSTSNEEEASASPRERTDSGIGQSHTPISSGRGRIRELLSSSSSSSEKQGTSIVGRGRGDIFRSYKSSVTPKESIPSTSKKIDVSDGSQKVTGSTLLKVAKSISDINLEQDTEHTTVPVIKRGTKGVQVKAACNYIRLESNPNKGVFEYEVRFSPDVDSRNLRFKYLNEHRDKFGGTKTFDGVTLYLPILLPNKETTYTTKNVSDGAVINIFIIYKRRKPLRECIQLYNVLFDRILKTLNYVRFDRKQYDPSSPKMIPQHKLEVWPGYVTAVDEYEDGIMLCCDVSHRLLCQTTVLDTLKQIYQSRPENLQLSAKKALLGSVVLTRYNNKTYRIDDINFETNPTSTFQIGDRHISYLEYYKTHYNITIIDKKQPLLVSVKQRRVSGKEEAEDIMFCLIPEICYLTGLRDEIRSDYKVMRDIATFTRVTPNQRMDALNKFYTNVNNCKDAREILENWGLKLSNKAEKLMARQLEEEIIFFNNKQYPAGQNADFGKYATSSELLEVINITNWILIHTKSDMRTAKSFMDCIERNSRPMGIQVSRPKVFILDNDRTETYVNTLREQITGITQIVVLICPTSRDDRYAAIKKICCAEIPVPSQVINSRTLSNEAKNRSIVQKIALQMNCKLGGTLWSVKIPFQKVMICGIDSYHDANQKGNSVSAFVASLNGVYTKWYSRAGIQNRKEELVNSLAVSFKYALQAYLRFNKYLPEKIIIFRDGVGDGQLKMCSEYEIPQLQDACRAENPNYNPLFTFIVVQKRINTRLFLDSQNNEYQNPNPGFILDHTVTRRYLYDFFLVSQSVRQGTVSPTHYVVVHDSANFSPDIIQRMSYKMCFLYYNWPGTVRVPACCQYAHKLAYLVGQSIKRPTSEKLADKLFYL